MADPAPNPIVCVPMKLDAFILNPAFCPPKNVKNPSSAALVAPVSQPDYASLQLDAGKLEPDVLTDIDLSTAGDITQNERFTSPPPVGDGKLRMNRFGIYLHWILPRLYRTGTSSTDDVSQPPGKANEQNRRAAQGFPALPDEDPDNKVPHFRSVPTRWLVIRRLQLDTVKPDGIADKLGLKEFTAWIVESDRIIDNVVQLQKAGVDIEVEMSQYPKGDLDAFEQVGKFIGAKFDASGWKEDATVDRVDLSILNSANQFLADFIPHNSNVFSILDNFSFDASPNALNVTEATASYQVIGWHTDQKVDQDPFDIVQAGVLTPTHQDRLNGCNLQLGGDTSATVISHWLDGQESTRVLCHGSMYSINYSSSSKPKSTPADGISETFSTVSPVTVGSTPLDTILAYVDAHVDPNVKAESDILESLHLLEPLLLKSEEIVDAQYEAKDMLSSHNFAPAAGKDTVWNLAGSVKDAVISDPTKQQLPGPGTTQPSPALLQKLATLNTLQRTLDQSVRELKLFRWSLFAAWWKIFSGDTSVTTLPTDQIQAFQTTIDSLQTQISNIVKALPANSVQKGEAQRFYTLNDPTMLISGIDSPWPVDFLDKLLVRLDTQLVPLTSGHYPPARGWTTFADFVNGTSNTPSPASVLPNVGMQSAAQKLMWEFYQLHPREDMSDPWTPENSSDQSVVMPLYHPDSRDLWGDTQPWFPLFVEWELEYFHIPYEYWAFENVQIPNELDRFRYGISAGTNLVSTKSSSDLRKVNGRVLILPQPSSSLGNIIDQLFKTTPIDVLESIMPGKANRDVFVKSVGTLQFLSSPLASFTDHLLTLLQGTHVKPTRRVPGQGISAFPAAVSHDYHLDEAAIMLMGAETGKTPYCTYAATTRPGYSPFKPATHGQFRFSKLNVIDKFGQAVSAMDLRISQPPPPLRPVISEYYRTQMLDANTPNTVLKDAVQGRYIQVPPNINQPARLNSCYIVRDAPSPTVPLPPWRPAAEWESPIWGWIIVNYMEEALQLFLPDGTFYREVRTGGVNGNTEQPKWQPFNPPNNVPITTQLDALLLKLSDQSANGVAYLRAFLNMITAAQDSIPHPSDEYADFLSAIVGRPLALVNTGWSLELSTLPLENQSSTNKTPPEKNLSDYPFTLKLGDRDRVYDGLVGYFEGIAQPDSDPLTQGPPVGAEFELKSLYTYFPAGGPTVDINNGPYETVYPYFFSSAGVDPATLMLKHTRKMKVISAIIDPYTPIHGYSGILPIQSLRPPSWAVQAGLKNMSTFFSVGPLVLTTPDILTRSKERLSSQTKAVDQGVSVPPNTVPPGTGVPIPVAKTAEWMWLQPILEAGATEWIPLGIEASDEKPAWEPGPYTAIEGYLQIRQTGGSVK